MLTLQRPSHEIEQLGCIEILDKLARVIDHECDLHVVFLGAACQLLLGCSFFDAKQAEIYDTREDRLAATNYIRFSDIAHKDQILGSCIYLG